MSGSTHDAHGNVIGFKRRSDKAARDFSEVRGRNVLNKLIDGHPEDEERLLRAHALLDDDPNYASAMHSAALALRTGKIRVFVSYRFDVDTELARVVADAFRELSAGKVEVTLAADFVRNISGQDYKEVIEREIGRAHWFVLLLSDPKRHSDWCMYETGMFRASMTSKRVNRLICIHHPDTGLPGPIEEFQAVPAVAGRVAAFLEGLFREEQPMPGWDALNRDVADTDLVEFAERVVGRIRGPSRPVNFNYSVVIEVERPSTIGQAEVLDVCRIDTDNKTADLFGKVEPPATWGELVANVRQGGRHDQWLVELLAVIRKACQKNTFRPISGTFESNHGGRIMRPVLESMEQVSGGDTYLVRLIFVEDLYSTPVQAVSAEVLAFLTALRVNSRLRWELIERFAQVQWNEDQTDACAQVLSRIEREGQSFSQWDLDALGANYAEPVRAEIRAIVNRWRELRRTGPSAAHTGPGELDLAFRAYDFAAVKSLLSECADLINRFLQLSYPVMEDLNQLD